MQKEIWNIKNLKFSQLLNAVGDILNITSSDVSDGVFLEMIEDGFIHNKFLTDGKWVTNETYSAWRNGKVPGQKNCANMAKYDKEASNAEIAEKYFSRYLAKNLMERYDTLKGRHQIQEFFSELQSIEGEENRLDGIKEIFENSDESRLISFFETAVRCSIKIARKRGNKEKISLPAAAGKNDVGVSGPTRQTTHNQKRFAILKKESLRSEDLDEAIGAGLISARPETYSDLTESHGQAFLLGDSRTVIKTAYKELFGILQGTVFHETNIKTSHIGESSKIYEYAENILHCDMRKFQAMCDQEIQRAKDNGYTDHPPKLWLHSFRRIESADDFYLTLTCGSSDYIHHRVYERILKENSKAREDFEELLAQIPQTFKAFNDDYPHVWSRMGCGCWIITEDNKIAVSVRGKNVAEVPGQVSYSSSGGMDRFICENGKQEDNTPSRSMLKEIREELGITSIKTEDLKLLSFGVDFSPWIQFSYVARCRESSAELRISHDNRARDKHEFQLAFIDLEPISIRELIRKTKMEAGAAYSLYCIYELVKERKLNGVLLGFPWRSD